MCWQGPKYVQKQCVLKKFRTGSLLGRGEQTQIQCVRPGPKASHFVWGRTHGGGQWGGSAGGGGGQWEGAMAGGGGLNLFVVVGGGGINKGASGGYKITSGIKRCHRDHVRRRPPERMRPEDVRHMLDHEPPAGRGPNQVRRPKGAKRASTSYTTCR